MGISFCEEFYPLKWKKSGILAVMSEYFTNLALDVFTKKTYLRKGEDSGLINKESYYTVLKQGILLSTIYTISQIYIDYGVHPV